MSNKLHAILEWVKSQQTNEGSFYFSVSLKIQRNFQPHFEVHPAALGSDEVIAQYSKNEYACDHPSNILLTHESNKIPEYHHTNNKRKGTN